MPHMYSIPNSQGGGQKLYISIVPIYLLSFLRIPRGPFLLGPDEEEIVVGKIYNIERKNENENETHASVYPYTRQQGR